MVGKRRASAPLLLALDTKPTPFMFPFAREQGVARRTACNRLLLTDECSTYGMGGEEQLTSSYPARTERLLVPPASLVNCQNLDLAGRSLDRNLAQGNSRRGKCREALPVGENKVHPQHCAPDAASGHTRLPWSG